MPDTSTINPTHLWDRLLAVPDSWTADAETTRRYCETLRPKAEYDTGSVPLASALILRALSEWLKPIVAIEIGTFIGHSTLALGKGAKHVYTCDKSNACLDSDARRTCFQKTGSTKMLRTLATMRIPKAALWFFDGRIQDPDVDLILGLSAPLPVYAFDDFSDVRGHDKGLANVAKLRPALSGSFVLLEPDQRLGPSTVAVLMPAALAVSVLSCV
jgi:hypothetical protein